MRQLKSAGITGWRGEEALLAMAGVLALASCAVLLCEGQSESRRQTIASEFQTLVHGVGLGPASDLSECAFAFDPRLAPSCQHDPGAFPLGGAFCPYHSLSVFPSIPPTPVKAAGARVHTL